MKWKLKIITSASAASFLAFAVLAQDTLNPKTEQTESTRQRIAQARAAQLNGWAKASDVIGMTVKNYQDEKLGKVNDLALDVESGRIVQVILSSGGILGAGDTLTAVPPGALHHDTAAKVLHLDVSKEKLKTAPRFDMSKWDECNRSNQVIEVYGYYGEEPYFIASRDANRTLNPDAVRAAELPRNMDGTVNTDAPSTVEKVRNLEIARNAEEASRTISTRNPDGTWTYSSYSSLGYVQKASKLMGTPVKNLQDQKLGKAENFVVDLAAGRIIAVIISSGGFIGIGDELSAVPPTVLRFNAQHDILLLDASKEMLAGSPHFKANQWPDLSQPVYVGGIYRAYKVEPYFITDGDRNNRTLTPLDQGKSQADVNTTAQIRKEIIAGENMSVSARNIMIITIDGRVTLRGPVNTAEEKRRIGEIAERIALAGNVDNQLEVKLTTSSNN